jgi:hypothetical protein
VLHEVREGYQRLVAGPFARHTDAEASFAVIWGFLARLAVLHRYPLTLAHALQPLRETPQLCTWDLRPIHATACLAVPQIIPEHLYIMDDGVMLATRPPQLIPSQVSATFDNPVHAKPEDTTVELALDAYMAAHAAPSVALRFLGLTTVLEILMKDEPRSPDQQGVLDRIVATIENDPGLKNDAAARPMLKNAIQAVASRKTMPKAGSLARLIARHKSSAQVALGSEQLPEDIDVLAKDIYRVRSGITHSGSLRRDEATLRIERALIAVAQASLLDWLDGAPLGTNANSARFEGYFAIVEIPQLGTDTKKMLQSGSCSERADQPRPHVGIGADHMHLVAIQHAVGPLHESASTRC